MNGLLSQLFIDCTEDILAKCALHSLHHSSARALLSVVWVTLRLLDARRRHKWWLCIAVSLALSCRHILPHLTLDGLLTPSWKSLYDFDSICSSDSTNWASNVQFAAHLINVLTLWEGAALPLDSNWFESRCRRLVIQYRVAVRSVQFSPGLRLNLFLFSLSLLSFFSFLSLYWAFYS